MIEQHSLLRRFSFVVFLLIRYKYLSSSTWEELLNWHPTVPVQAKALVDMTYPIDDLIAPQQNDMPIEDDGFHLPTVSENLIARFKQLVASMTEPLLPNNQGLVLYQLEQYRDNSSLVVCLIFWPTLFLPFSVAINEFGLV